MLFLVGKMKRIWGYTLFWFAMGMLLMYIIGGGCIGILLIAGSPVSYTHLDVYKRQVCVSCFFMIMNVAMKLRDNFYRLAAVGLGTLYALQVFLTIGGVIKFIPSTGVTLSLIHIWLRSVDQL